MRRIFKLTHQGQHWCSQRIYYGLGYEGSQCSHRLVAVIFMEMGYNCALYLCDKWTWDRQLWGFPPPNFSGLGEKFSKVGFKTWYHTKLVCKFRGNSLRDGWDPLSRNLGPKQTNQAQPKAFWIRPCVPQNPVRSTPLFIWVGLCGGQTYRTRLNLPLICPFCVCSAEHVTNMECRPYMCRYLADFMSVTSAEMSG